MVGRSTGRGGLKPMFLEKAEELYGEAFEARSRKELAEAMMEWSDLTEEEQRFALAHLMYLNVQGQAVVAKGIGQLRDLLEEIAEGLAGVMEMWEPEEDAADETATDPHGPEGAVKALDEPMVEQTELNPT